MDDTAKISVVLTTYNGEGFISEQLKSILSQTRLPDEIIVLDDCSSDGTVEIINDMIRDIEPVECRFIVNENNKGWRRNFIDGFHMASGDIIFCADQDDIWDNRKIELMEKALNDNDNINVLACNLTPLYEDEATKLADFYIKRYGNERIAHVGLLDHGFMVLRPGCTMCFRKTILDLVDQIWDEKLAHDEVLWAIGVVTDSLYILNVPLIQFRRHGKNNSPSNKKRISSRLERAKCENTKIRNILRALDTTLDEHKLDYLTNRLNLVQTRMDAFQSGKIRGIVEITRNIKLYTGIRAYIADLVCILRG